MNPDGSPVSVYIGLGSNLDDPQARVTQASEMLKAHPALHDVTISPWYRSDPVGPGVQPDYINGVIKATCDLEPEALLDLLQQIENSQQRERNVRWGARTIDLDILLYGEQKIKTDRLQIPHPRLCERNFVVYPLYDISPELILPNGVSIESLLAALGDAGLDRL